MALTGERVDRSSLEGRPFVLNFWATWCIPCAQEHPALLEVARRYGDRIQFYGVLYGDDTDKAKPGSRNAAARFRRSSIHRDGPRSTTAWGCPRDVHRERAGEIVEKVVGPIDPNAVARVLETLR